MPEIDVALITLAGSVVLAVVSYLLNGWRERSFERRKTNYHSKLTAFQQINTASQGLSNAYLYLRWLSSVDWEKLDIDDSLPQAMMFVALAREEEAPLGTGVSQSLASEYEKIASATGEKQKRAAAVRWTEAATQSLVILWVRLLTYHLNRLGKASTDALLVAETPAVQDAIGRLVDHVGNQLRSVEERQENEGRSFPKSNRSERTCCHSFGHCKWQCGTSSLLPCFQTGVEDDGWHYSAEVEPNNQLTTSLSRKSDSSQLSSRRAARNAIRPPRLQ